MNDTQDVAVAAPALPKGGGAIQSIGHGWGAVGVSGAASLGIPLPISPGRGFAPALSLSYSSAGGRTEFGQGWSISLPAIAVRSNNGVPQYGKDADGRAIQQEFVAPDGDLLLAELDAAGEPTSRDTRLFRGVNLGADYRVEGYLARVAGNGARYERWVSKSDGETAFWLMHTADGTLHLYGRTARTEHVHTQDVSSVRWIAEWLLEESVSPNGEHVYYEYMAEDGAGLDDASVPSGWQGRDRECRRYLHRARYGNHAPASDSEAVLVPFLLQPDIGTRKWHFDLVFDYGARDTELAATPPYAISAGSSWPMRLDPVSHYRYGFEVRTLRLCHQVLMFHAFPDLGDAPVLVRRTLFEYEPGPEVSQLVAVHDVGYGKDGPEYMPPLELEYGRFVLPAENAAAPFVPFVPFEPDPPGSGKRFPGLDDGNRHQLVDLFGEGLPGVLSRGAGGWWYRRPIRNAEEGSGCDDVAYAPWQHLGRVPVANLGAPVRQFLTDLSGDGRLDWVVAQPGLAGFFSLGPDQAWERFTPYAAFPQEFFHPQAQLADLVGAGLSDVVLIGTRSVRLYANLRADDADPTRRGFARPVTVPRAEVDALPVLGDDRSEVVAFSDVLGSGQQHLVRIRHDEVMCFPNLGRGRFGAPINLAELPFARDSFNPAHVRLADLDGSGAADLVYFQARTIQVFLNRSGHGFAPPVTLTLPDAMPYDAIVALSVADLDGLGCSSLVVTVQRPAVDAQRDGHAGLRPMHWRCDFVNGVKPYLLSRTDNNMGTEGRVDYRSSAQEWLDEKQEYADPALAACGLPFPIHVVKRQVQLDQITGNRLTQSFQYRGGYYDGVEREFRGFARLWQTDTETQAGSGVQDDEFTAPVQTRTWFHVGRAIDPERHGTYDGDPYAQAHPLGPTLRGTTVSATGADGIVGQWDDDVGLHAGTDRDGARALSGMSWRSEVWRVAASAAEIPETPYSVSETRYLLRRLSHRTGSRRYARLHPLVVEQRGFNYDGQQDDPSCQHSVGLCWDRHGDPIQSVHIAYARREDARPPFDDDGSEDNTHFIRWWTDAHDTAQQNYYLTESLGKTIHLDDVLVPDYWRLHLPCRGRGHAWVLHRKDDAVLPEDLGYEALRGEDSLLLRHADTRVLTGQALMRYQDCVDDTADFKALPAYAESAELDELALQAYIPPGETVSKLGATPEEVADKLREVGYVAIGSWDPVHGVSPIPSPPDLWAVHRGFATYAGLAGFRRTIAYKPVRSAGETTVAYDADYCVTQSVTLPDGCKTRVIAVDYRTFGPLRIDDPNENSQEACYDGLGRLVAHSFWGTEPEIDADGVAGLPKPVGFAHIDTFKRTYSLPGEAIADPLNAIQDVAEAFFYDAFSSVRVTPELVARVPPSLVAEVLWSVPGQLAYYLRASVRWRLTDATTFPGLPADVRASLLDLARQPVQSASLQADRYPGDPERQIRMSVSASDGFGRVLQAKQRVPDGEAYLVEDGRLVLDESGQPRREFASPRWRVSERVEYNNKGLTVRVYRPYFASTHEHIRDEAFRDFGYCDRWYYDPLGRPLRMLTPREERVETPRVQPEKKRVWSKRLKRPVREAPTWIVKWYMKRWTYYPWYTVAEDENDTALEMESARYTLPATTS